MSMGAVGRRRSPSFFLPVLGSLTPGSSCRTPPYLSKILLGRSNDALRLSLRTLGRAPPNLPPVFRQTVAPILEVLSSVVLESFHNFFSSFSILNVFSSSEMQRVRSSSGDGAEEDSDQKALQGRVLVCSSSLLISCCSRFFSVC